ncbi:MAG: VaFE repeat-containing surface-anchored protein [Eggerthellaceae bacterium]|nr:VaFE repeat-containing surface-anchored protein [Eggerthellaceae bacterium]
MQDKLLQNSKTNKIISLIMVVMLAIGMIPAGAIAASADKAYAADSVEVISGDRIYYDGWFTRDMNTSAGAPVICVQPAKPSPVTGEYAKQDLLVEASGGQQGASIRSALYYGYGSPGFEPSYWPATWYDGSEMTPDRYRVCQHLLLSDMYALNSAPALKGCSQNFKQWVWSNVIGYEPGGQVDNYENMTRGQIEANAYNVPDDFNCYAIGGGSYQVCVTFDKTGFAQVAKTSTNADITVGNSCYTLAGIVYDLYRDASCTDYAGSVTLDANGSSNTLELNAGTYYARENQASTEGKGYAWDSSVHTVVVSSGETTTLSVADKPQNDPAAMLAGKIDLETTRNLPQGSASLAGAEFTVRYYDGYYDTVEAAEASGQPTRTWVVATDEDGYADLSDEYKVAGDDLYYHSNGDPTLPLGTVLIKEIKAPIGYNINDDEVYVRQITSNSFMESVTTFHIPTVPEQVKRGDLEFVKTSEKNMARLANVPFRLTSETTGENHILVTDENGYVSTSSNWNLHSNNTNNNDDVIDEAFDNESGVWFGQDAEGNKAALNDEVGALPYDTYTLEELPCSANEGHKLITLNGIVVKRDSKTVDLGTLDDPVSDIYLGTTAYDGEDLDKAIAPDPTSVVIDNVEYMNLIEGKTYTLEAQLMHAQTGDPIKINGEDVIVRKDFVPVTTNGKITMTIPFNAVDFAGTDIVVYERMYLGDKLVGEHSDPSDPDQIVRVLQPTLGTTAVDGEDGDKTLVASDNNTIVDKVEYTNLVPGKEYTVSGKLMVKGFDEDGNAVMSVATNAQGDEISASTTFTPTEKDGMVEVTFTVPAELYDNGSSIVVFETLLRGDVVIVSHEDPNDEDQTVVIAYPEIKTTAYDKNYDEKVVVADKDAGIRDIVSYENLVSGAEYTLYGILMNKTTEQPLIIEDATEDEPTVDNGELATMMDELRDVLGFEEMDMDSSGVIKPVDFDMDAVKTILAKYPELSSAIVTSDATFAPEKVSGKTEVNFTFDASQWIKDESAPQTVVFEMLVKDDRIVAVHTDINDEGQTVQITPSSIGTTATDKTDGDHEALPSKETTIVDKVEYTNLVPGKEYTLFGKLMLKETGEQLIIDDKPVESVTTFVPNDANGFVEIEFTFDSTSLLNKEIVAFESVSKDGIEVAVHADINDEAQTVIIKNPPDGTGFSKTGGNTWIFVLLILAAAGVATYFARRYYLSRKKDVTEASSENKDADTDDSDNEDLSDDEIDQQDIEETSKDSEE